MKSTIQFWLAIVLTVWAGPFGAATLKSAVLVSESFEYEDGVLTVESGGTWQTHSGTVGQLEAAGGRVWLTQKETEDVHIVLPGQPYTDEGFDAIYAQFKLRYTELPVGSAGAYFAHFKDSGNGFRGRIFACTNGAAPGHFRLGIANGANAASATVERDLSLDIEYRVVLRVVVSNATTCLWIDPAAESDPGSVAADTAAPIDIVGFCWRQALSNGNGMGTLAVDDLVIGTQFSDLAGTGVGAPVILRAPASQTVLAGSDVTFSVSASGLKPMGYQWLLEGQALPGANAEMLLLSAVTTNQSGCYQVTITNSAGAVTSGPAVLIVQEAPANHRPPALVFTNYLENPSRPGDAPTNQFDELVIVPGERLRIEVESGAADDWDVVLAPVGGLPSGGHWEMAAAGANRAGGTFLFEPDESERGTEFEVGLEARSGTGTNAVGWRIYVPTAAEQDVIVNEFLANPARTNSAPHFNPLDRSEPAPAPSSDDEYIELVNGGAVAVDLSEWTISDAKEVRHCFSETFVLGAAGAVIVYGGPRAGFEPRLKAPAVPANVSAAGLSLNNTDGDTIVVRNGRSNLVCRVVYSAVAVESALTRDPDLRGPFVRHADVGALAVSPGTRIDGTVFSAGESHPPVSIVVSVSIQGGQLELTWIAEATQVYSLWESDQVGGLFVRTLDRVQFGDGVGKITVPINEESVTRFFQVSTP